MREPAKAAPGTGPSAKGAASEPAAWAIAVTATLGMSVSYIDRQTLAAIAPAVTKALAIDNTQYGWLLGAFSMAYLVGAPLAGRMVDRLGARRGFALAVLAWSIVAGTHAFATSFAMLFLLRMLLGATEAPSFPAAAQAIRRALPGARRPLAFGFLFTGSSLGAIVAAKLAIALEARYGYRGAFVGTALAGLIWLPLWLTVTRRAGLDRPAITPGEVVLDATRRRANDFTIASVLRSPPVLRAVIAVTGSAPALMFVLNWTSKYLVDGWHLPKESVGNYLIAAPLLFDVGAVGFGFLASLREEAEAGREHAGGARRTHKDLLVLSMALAASLALAPLAPSPGVAVALCAASACGGGGIYALVTADMLARVPIGRASTAGGMTAAAQSLAHVVASPLVGWSVDRTGSYGAALVGLGLVVVPTSLAFVLWHEGHLARR